MLRGLFQDIDNCALSLANQEDLDGRYSHQLLSRKLIEWVREQHKIKPFNFICFLTHRSLISHPGKLQHYFEETNKSDKKVGNVYFTSTLIKNFLIETGLTDVITFVSQRDDAKVGFGKGYLSTQQYETEVTKAFEKAKESKSDFSFPAIHPSKALTEFDSFSKNPQIHQAFSYFKKQYPNKQMNWNYVDDSLAFCCLAAHMDLPQGYTLKVSFHNSFSNYSNAMVTPIPKEFLKTELESKPQTPCADFYKTYLDSIISEFSAQNNLSKLTIENRAALEAFFKTHHIRLPIHKIITLMRHDEITIKTNCCFFSTASTKLFIKANTNLSLAQCTATAITLPQKSLCIKS